MWLSTIGLIQHDLIEGHLPWIFIKDFFAAVKNVSGLVKSILSKRRRSKKMGKIEVKLAEFSQDKIEGETYSLLKTYMVKRRK